MGDAVVMLTAVVCAGVLMVFVLVVPGLGLLLVEVWGLVACCALAVLARREIRVLQEIERGS
jgi:hypothetical protein